MDIREDRANEKEMRHAPAERRTMWERNAPVFADNEGILEAEQKQRIDVAENIARCAEDKIKPKVNKIKWNDARHLEGFEFQEMVKKSPNMGTQ